jgi:hypothetical protein
VRGIGELSGTPANPEHVAQLEQTFTAPYVDRGILFFREKKDDHPFPDLSALKRPEKPGHPKSLAANERAHAEALPKAVPLPVPRTPPRIVAPRREQWPRQEPWYTAGGM